MKTARLLACGSLWFLLLAWSSIPAMAAADGWGASYSFGPVSPSSTNHIIYAKTTLVPGRLPVSYWSSSSIGPLFLWPGMSNPTSDLVQTTMDAWSGSTNSSYCGAATGQWCVEASVFGSFGQRNGSTVAIDPDDHVTIEYKLGSDNNTWTQTVTSQKLGKVVSTLTSTSGLMLGGGFGFATEADADSFTVDTAYYLCTEILLAEADPNFASTGSGGTGAQYGATGTGSGVGTAKNVHTPDNGVTWLIDLITLPAMNPQGTQTSTPTYDCTTSSGGTSGSGGSTGSGGSSGSGGSTGKGGTSGSGGSSSSGGSSGSGGGVGSGGSTGKGGTSGSGGVVGSGGSTGKGGSSGSGGGVGSGGSTGKGGTSGSGGSSGSSGSGGAAVAGTTGSSGGAVGSGGSVAAGSGGSTGSGGSKGTGGASQGSGGSVAAGSGGKSGSGGTGGSTGTSASASSGCGCDVGARSPRGGMSAFLLLAALALLARRRR